MLPDGPVLTLVRDTLILIDALATVLEDVRTLPRALRVAVHMEIAMPVQLRDDDTATATVTFTDALGDATTIHDAVTWSVDDPTLATVTPSDDGLSATVQPLAGSGTFHVQVVAGNLSGTSDDIVIDPGAATMASVLVIEATPTPPTPPPAPTPAAG